MKRIAILTLGLLGSAMLLPTASAQVLTGHNSNAPVDFNAGRIEIQDRSDRVVLSGGVQVTQGNLTLRSARMTIAYSNGRNINVNRIDATGNVVITRGDERATGNAAIYDLDRRLITLVGDVTLRQSGNDLNGGRLVIDLDSGKAVIDGSGGGAPPPGIESAGPGRVTGTFTVPQNSR
ncbi:MAG: OstA family protein [Sphingorhabdus sp.]|nr:OstA family protein [Sphingorhabdus sp.]